MSAIVITSVATQLAGAYQRLRHALASTPNRRNRIILLFLTGLFLALGAELLIVGMM